jgi:hypothetical protein
LDIIPNKVEKQNASKQIRFEVKEPIAFSKAQATTPFL